MKQVIQVDYWSYHFWKGIESNFPLCCIIWFCNCVTNYGLQENSLYERIFKENYNGILTHKMVNFNGGRNMCPDCKLNKMKKEITKLQECDV